MIPRTLIFAALAAAASALLPAGAARAEEPAAPAAGASAASGAPAAQPAGETPAPKVRASHRIEIIAPGERVETVLDRLRGVRPEGGAAGGGGATRPALPVREPGATRDEGRRTETAPAGGGHGPGGGAGGPPAPGSSSTPSPPTGAEGGRVEGPRPRR